MEQINKKVERPHYSEMELGEIYGGYETLPIPIDQLVILPQVRGRLNPAQSELTASILNGKLINQVDIAIMSSEKLSDHLNFINGIWKTEVTLADYPKPNNGVYSVLIAGHSRVAAIKAIQAEAGSPKSVTCKIHQISSSAEFLSLQLAENTYGGINPERRAIAIVEMYHYGYNENATQNDTNHWHSYADFIRKNPGNLNKEILSDGMAFAVLSPEVRDYIFAGKLYYGAGVEIGKNANTIQDYVSHRLGETATKEDIEKAYNYELAILINQLTDSRRNLKGSLKKSIAYIKNRVSYMKDIVKPPKTEDYQQSMSDFILDAPDRQYKAYWQELNNDYKNIISQLKKRPTEEVIRCLQLASALTGENHTEDIAVVRKAYTQHIGNAAVKSLIDIAE